MPIDSGSTFAEVVAQYEDNLDYDIEHSVDKAKLFIAAARMYLRRMAERADHGAQSYQHDPGKIKDELKKAEEWWRANDEDTPSTAASARFMSFESFRS